VARRSPPPGEMDGAGAMSKIRLKRVPEKDDLIRVEQSGGQIAVFKNGIKLDADEYEIGEDDADKKAAELLPCRCSLRTSSDQTIDREHIRSCPAYYRPAVAAALREAATPHGLMLSADLAKLLNDKDAEIADLESEYKLVRDNLVKSEAEIEQWKRGEQIGACLMKIEKLNDELAREQLAHVLVEQDFAKLKAELEQAAERQREKDAETSQLEYSVYRNNEINDHQRSEIEALKAELAKAAERQRKAEWLLWYFTGSHADVLYAKYADKIANAILAQAEGEK